jgi:hypothetical protein
MTTIRERLKAQMFKARVAAFGFWLLGAACMFLPKGYETFFFVPFAGFACAVLYVLFFIKCPKCGVRLGQAMSSMGKANFCLGCGVSLDNRV